MNCTVNNDVTFTAQWDDPPPPPPNTRVYIGVAAFNDKVDISELSLDLEKAKTAINNANNKVDATALCYAVSKSITLFDKPGLPSFDHTFVVTFTDGADNISSVLYVKDGNPVPQAKVYEQASSELSSKSALKSYAIGFKGKEPINDTELKTLVKNGGVYKAATNASELQSVFKGIAKSVLASAKNVTLKTNTGFFPDYNPKYFKLTLKAVSDLDVPNLPVETDIVYGRLEYDIQNPNAVPFFTVSQGGGYTTFDNSGGVIYGKVESGKILLPFSNLKHTRNGEEYFIQSIEVEVGVDGINYRKDSEDSSVDEDIDKTIGVVLVIDCSGSLGDVFPEVQSAACNFIDILGTAIQ